MEEVGEKGVSVQTGYFKVTRFSLPDRKTNATL